MAPTFSLISEEDMNLINAVQSRPMLYEKTRDMKLYEAAWEEVGKLLLIEPSKAKQRWKCLRHSWTTRNGRICKKYTTPRIVEMDKLLEFLKQHSRSKAIGIYQMMQSAPGTKKKPFDKQDQTVVAEFVKLLETALPAINVYFHKVENEKSFDDMSLLFDGMRQLFGRSGSGEDPSLAVGRKSSTDSNDLPLMHPTNVQGNDSPMLDVAALPAAPPAAPPRSHMNISAIKEENFFPLFGVLIQVPLNFT